MKLKDKTCIVTGAAGGIGLETARRFADEGARVSLWDVNSEALDKAKAELEKTDAKVHVRVVDVTSEEDVTAAYDDVEEALGPVDVVVNNAGITRDAMVHKMESSGFDAVIAVNLRGVFLVGREAARRMRERQSGVILNTSSVVAGYGNIGQSNYTAAKAGVEAMTKTWARELGRKGVRVNALAPGFIATEMTSTVPEKVLDMVCSKTPLGRLGKPQEIAAAMAFLASDEASFITGHVLGVDGGLVL